MSKAALLVLMLSSFAISEPRNFSEMVSPYLQGFANKLNSVLEADRIFFSPKIAKFGESL